MRILVAGAGAIGQWLGARLHRAGHDVTLLLRPAFKQAIDAAGLTVRGHTRFKGRVPSITDLDDAPEDLDAVFLTAKAYATAPLAEATAPLLASDGVLASMQNGLGNGEKLARAVPVDRAAVCLTSHGLNVERPGKIQHAGTGATRVGPVSGHPDADAGARRARALLHDAGLEPQWCQEMRAPVWHKAIVNAAINPVGALYTVRNGRILQRPELRSLARSLATEAAALATAARVDMTDFDALATVEGVLVATAKNRCSMLQDVESKRATELEQITGRMVRLAERLLVPMPRSESIYGRVKDLERSYLGDEAAERLAWDELPFLRDPF